MNTVRRFLALTTAVLTAVLAMLVATGGSASAVQLYGAQQTPGSITPYKVVGAKVNTCAATGSYCPKPAVTVPGPTIGRSAASNGTQDLQVQYRIYRWNGSTWGYHTGVNRTYRIQHDQSRIRLQDERFMTGSNGHYYVEMSFTWQVATTPTMIGQRSVAYNGAYDYSCGTSGCQTGTGWVRLF